MSATQPVQPARAVDCPTWHGTEYDETHLLDVLAHNCERRTDLDPGGPTSRCFACPTCLLYVDQQALDRLAFVATLRERLWHEEYDVRSDLPPLVSDLWPGS